MTAKRDIILTYTDTSADIASVVRASTVPRQDADSPLQPNEVAVEFLASPVNPQDVLVISGKYPVKPSWEHEGRPIPGYDGVCQVVAVGSSVAGFSEGDRAIPAKHGLGTWRSFAVVDASLLIKVPQELDPVAGSVLKMGGVVAACLLKERERLMPGDWIIQNAGAGVVSCLVAQLAKMRGVRTCSIVRDRRPQGLEGSSSAVTSQGGKDKEAESEQDTETLKLKQRLLQAGADAVVTESELQAAGSSTLACLQGQRVVLGLDSVFGESGTRLVGQLSPGATYINYGSLGGMDSKLCLGQQDVFWKRIAFRNFRLSEWTSGMAPEELRDLLQWLAEEFVSGRLRAPELDVLDLTASALASGLPAGEQQEDKTQEKLQELVQQALARSTASSSVGAKKLVLLFTKDASKDKDLASSEGVAAAADGTQGGCLGADGLAIRPGGAAPSS